MIAKIEKVLHVHHIVGVVFVLPSESFQDLQLHQRLMVKSEVVGEWQGGQGMGTEFIVSCHTAAVSPFLQPLPITVQGGWGRKHQKLHILASSLPRCGIR